MRKRHSFAILMSILLATGLSGCASEEAGHGGPLKKTADVMATAAVEIMSASTDSTVSNAWQDAGGMWHWTKVEQGVGTFDCEGRQLGIPKECDKVGAP